MKKAEKWLKRILVFLIKVMLPKRQEDTIDVKWHDFSRVLVFRLDNRLGNSILILSLIQSIKKSLPDVTMDILITSSYVELYQNHPDINHIIPYDQKSLFRNPIRFISLIKRLRKNKYDAVFSSNNPDAFSVSQAIFTRLVSHNRSVGFKWKESEKIYTDVVTGNTKVHYARAQCDLWRYFDKQAEYKPPRIYFLKKNTTSAAYPILFWLGATGNKILNEKIVNSIILALEELTISVHLAVGPHDEQLLDIYQKPWRERIRVMNFTIKQIAEYFMKFKCICMPDTGPMHLVAALEIPLVQIFVDSNINQYGYTGPDKFIINRTLDIDPFQKFIRKQISST
jgi:ADP-heptose:LPS heptosyltransferase